MFLFKNKQKTFEIGSFLVGGEPGENFPLVFGGIKGISPENKEKLREEIKIQDSLSQEYNLSSSIDLFIRKQEHIQERIDFIIESTPYPFSIDLPFGNIELKKTLLEYVSKRNLQDRIIYNSINSVTSDEEVELLKNYGVISAILLASNMADKSTNGSLNLLEKKLLPIAEKAGIKNILVDPGTLPISSKNVAGEVLRSIMTLKSETGFPIGCAMINTAETCTYFKDSKEGYSEAIAALNAGPLLLGADFILYGPINMAKKLLPAIAIISRIRAEANKNYFGVGIND